MRKTRTPTLPFLAFGLAAVVGCGAGAPAPSPASPQQPPDPSGGASVPAPVEPRLASVRGHVSDAGLGSFTPGFGGAGTTARARQVVVSRLGSGGALSEVGRADIAGGAFHVDVPAAAENLIIQATDGDGAVVAAGVVYTSGPAGGSVTIAPLGTRSSIAAGTLTEMTSCAGDDFVDSAAATTALEVALHGGLTLDAAVNPRTIAGLANALLAAQTARSQALAKSGVALSPHDLFLATLPVIGAHDAALDAALGRAGAAATDDDAGNALPAQLTRARAAAGLASDTQAWAEIAASLAARATHRHSQDANLDAALKGSVSLEASAVAAAVLALTGELGADAAAAQPMTDLAARLEAQVATAPGTQAALDAGAAFANGLVDTLTKLLTGILVGVPVVVTITLAIVVPIALGIVGDVVKGLLGGVLPLKASVCVDAHALGATVAAAVADLQVKLMAQAALLTSLGTKAEVTAKLLAITSAAFQPLP